MSDLMVIIMLVIMIGFVFNVILYFKLLNLWLKATSTGVRI